MSLLWLAPHPPYDAVLAPPIRFVFGETVLHYPAHLWFLYHAMKYTHVVAAVLVGACMSGVACAMVRQIHEGAALSLRAALQGGSVRYGTMVILWLVTWGLAKGALTVLSRVASVGFGTLAIGVGMALLLQVLLGYAIPAAVFTGVSWWRALVASVREAVRHPLSTVLVVALPSLALIALSVLMPSTRVGLWQMQSLPEIALVCAAARLAVWLVADAVLTVSVAHLWWLHRAPAVARATATPPRILGRNRKGFGLLLAGSLCLILATSGCSNAYNGERLYWKAQQLYLPIGQDRANRTPERIAKVIRAYEVVIKRVPHTVWAARAHVVIASLDIMQQQHEQGRQAYAKILKDYSQFPDLCVVARYAIARSFEAQGKWEEAARAYQELADSHPWTTTGLQAPLYVANGYATRRQPEAATSASERAVNFYTKLIPNAPSPALMLQAKGYLAVALDQLGKWEEAAALLEELRQRPDSMNRPLVLLALGIIYQRQVGSREHAKALYTELIDQFPAHRLAQIAKEKLTQLEASSPEVPGDSSSLLQAIPTLLTPPTERRPSGPSGVPEPEGVRPTR